MSDEMKKNGDFYELRTHDESYSRSFFLAYQDKTFGHDGVALHGDRYTDRIITRFHNGLLHGGYDTVGEPQPAIVLPDNLGVEWWEKGKLHREEGPAVIAKFGDWEEYWNRGTLILIRAKDAITQNPNYKKQVSS